MPNNIVRPVTDTICKTFLSEKWEIVTKVSKTSPVSKFSSWQINKYLLTNVALIYFCFFITSNTVMSVRIIFCKEHPFTLNTHKSALTTETLTLLH